LLFALLTGGDYDEGVRGCGANIAHGLAKCAFGQQLRHILVSYAGTRRTVELAVWREHLRAELKTNTSKLLGKKQRKLAECIPDPFPNSRVVDLYTNPYTSSSFNYMAQAPKTNDWVPREPDIPALARFACQNLNWGQEDLTQHFPTVIWPAVAFRMISLVRLYSAESNFPSDGRHIPSNL
ncbi:hypothetical protein R3P38DRAFT_2512640, partial [Favolaschia claudopus]